MRVVNTGFVKDWRVVVVVVAIGIGMEDALQMGRIEGTDYILNE